MKRQILMQYVLIIICISLLVVCISLFGQFVQAKKQIEELEFNYVKIKKEYSTDKKKFEEELEKIKKVNQKLQEENKKLIVNKRNNKQKIIYLTFDDGPSLNTLNVLKILEEKEVKATFFVINSSSKTIYRKIIETQNAIGLHTYSHNYQKVYASINSYIDDLNKIKKQVLKYTGKDIKIVRLPGGSSNSFVSNNDLKKIKQYLYNKNLTYYDWNCSSEDATGIGVSVDYIIKSAISCTRHKKINLLMHDGYGHENTVKALPTIIDYYKKRGYIFKVIDDNATVIQHR